LSDNARAFKSDPSAGVLSMVLFQPSLFERPRRNDRRLSSILFHCARRANLANMTGSWAGFYQTSVFSKVSRQNAYPTTERDKRWSGAFLFPSTPLAISNAWNQRPRTTATLYGRGG
jgi:hypothetical protein